MSDITKPTIDNLIGYLNYQYPATQGDLQLRAFCKEIRELNNKIKNTHLIAVSLARLTFPLDDLIEQLIDETKTKE